MKKLNQHLLLAAAMMLMAGSAYAQAPTNQYGGNPARPVIAPTNTHSPNAEVKGASAGTYSKNYSDYSQDSYVSQTGSGNYATVDQSDSRSSKANGGSTAILNQTGDNNTATQTQTLTTTTFSNGTAATGGRDLVKSTQAGSASQSNQTQNGGGYNTEIVNQGVGTTGNRAIQTQNVSSFGGDGNLATINQTQYSAGTGSGNRAEQTQSGLNGVAQIDQQSSNSYAKQTQSGNSSSNIANSNNAYIGQGAPGSTNTAMQTQDGIGNAAAIRQSVGGGNAGSNNYALQNQTMNGNQADITQRSSNNYAEQQQSGLAGGGNNYSSITQSNVASAAYTTQSGNNNAVIVTQH